MALQYVGGASGTGTGATYSVSLTSLTGGIGSSAAAGDIVIVVTGWASTTDDNPGVTTAGYTELADLYSNDTNDANLSVSYKLMGGTPDTSVTVSGPNSATNGGATVVHVWRGVNQTTPIDVTTTTASAQINGANANAPAITPVTAGAVVIACGGGTGPTTQAAPSATPSGLSNQVAVNGDGSTRDFYAVVASAAWTSGALDPATWTAGTSSNSESWAAATLALRPKNPGTSTIVTDFTSGAGVWRTDVSGAGATATVTGGVAQVSVDQAVNQYAHFWADNTSYDLTGDSFYLKVPTYLSPVGNGTEQGFGLSQTWGSNYLGWTSDYDGALKAYYRSGGTLTAVFTASAGWSQATYRWLRVRESGGTVFWDSAPSTASDPPASGDWVNRGSATLATIGYGVDSVIATLFIRNITANTSAASYVGEFDGINTATAPSTSVALTGRSATTTAGTLSAGTTLSLSALAEDFTAGTLDTGKWVWDPAYNNGTAASSANYDITSGVFHFKATSTAAFDSDGRLRTVSNYSGDAGTFLRARVDLSAANSNLIEFQMALGDGTFSDQAVSKTSYVGLEYSEGVFYRQVRNGGTLAINRTDVTYNATNHAWWQIRFDATNIYLETAPDSSGSPGTFTTLDTIARSTVTGWSLGYVKAQFVRRNMATVLSSTTDGVVGLDNINAAAVTSVALTGQGVTASRGGLVPASARSLTGQAVAPSAGSLTPSVSFAASLTGQSVTSARGTLSVDTQRALTGQAVTASRGSLGADSGVSAALTGQQVTTARGAPGISTSIAVSGQQASLARGTVSAGADRTVSLSGVSLTAAKGLPKVGTRPGFGVNLHNGSDAATNTAIADALAYRQLHHKVRFDLIWDGSQTNNRDLANKIIARGGSVQGSLQVAYQWDWNYWGSDLTAVHDGAYTQTYNFVNANKDVFTDYELLNEVQWRSEVVVDAPNGDQMESTTAYESSVGCLRLASCLKGMADAIRDLRASSGLPLRVIMGFVGRDWGFATFLRNHGVDWDVTGFHAYPRNDQALISTDTWYGNGINVFARMAQLGRPVTYNEFNAGEVYNTTYTNVEGNTDVEQGMLSVNKNINAMMAQAYCDLESLTMYELFDRVPDTTSENRFGLIHGTTITDPPKTTLYIVTAYAGGTLTSTERAEITTERTLLTNAQIDALMVNKDVALTGQSATVARGTFTPSTAASPSVALTGQAITASRGSVAPINAISLTGQGIPVSAGLLSSGMATTITLAGQSVTLTRGLPTAYLGLNVDGSAIIEAISSASASATSNQLWNTVQDTAGAWTEVSGPETVWTTV